MSSPDSSGIFTGVLDFISRELESFVTTATGGHVPEHTERRRSSRYSSSRSRKRRKHSKRRDYTSSSSSSYSSESDSEGSEHQHSRKRDEEQTTLKAHRKRRREPEPHIPKNRRRVDRTPSPSLDEDSTAQTTRPESPQLIQVEHQVMGPPPVPISKLKRPESITMPGSLYPRSPSMDPEPLYRHLNIPSRVRFAPSPSQPPPNGMHSEVGFSKVSSTSPLVSTPSHSPVRAAIQRFHMDADSSILLPNPKRIASVEATWRASPPHVSRTQAEYTASFKAKGKRRAIDTTSEDDTSDHETSGELRVRGKERELKNAILQQIENETRRERQATEEPEEFDSYEAGKEKEHDKRRIRQLEEEIRLLKDELARRPSNDNSTMIMLQVPPAPPAPPPPPPPPNRAILRLPSIMDDAGILFTAARASLTHQSTPKEKPINPPHISRHQGQPTVGITPDKMAAFLQEMKSVRLRKTGMDLDSSSSFSSGSSRALLNGSSTSLRGSRADNTTRVDGDESFLSRSLVVPQFRHSVLSTNPQAAEMRKRRDTVQDPQNLTKTRPLMPAPQLSTQPRTHAQSSSSSSSASPVGLFSEASISSTEPATSDQGGSQPTQTREPAPTPSLCSDNDPERDDEQAPSTPPLIVPNRNVYRFRGKGIPVTLSEHSRSLLFDRSLLKSQGLTHEEEQEDGQHPDHERECEEGNHVQVIDHHMDRPVDYEDRIVPIHPVTPEGSANLSEQTMFTKRIPISPLPNKSPRKPHPPNRRRSTPHPKKLSLPPIDHEDGEPLPALSFTTPPAAISTPGFAQDVPQALDTPDVFAERKQTRNRPPPSRIPIPSSRISHKSSLEFKKSQTSRHLTLGEELWIAQQSDEMDEGDDPDEGLYTGTGTMSKTQGFLAHGGGGGKPVLMGIDPIVGTGGEHEGLPEVD